MTEEAPCDLSIVIINWNTREMTRECLASTYEGLARAPELTAEVILVDNASEDGSADMVAADFPQAILIRNADNRGFAAANNQGFEIAKGRQILLLNSDTLVIGDVLARSVAYLDEAPATGAGKVGAMGCRILNADGTMQPSCHMYPSLLNQLLMASGLWKLKRPAFFGRMHMTDWLRDSEREVEVISGCYLLLRREVLEEVGPLDDDFFFFGEETDWCKRMRDAGWRLMFSPVGEITHYGGGSVKKLNHKRDVMLTGAKVKLHRKHGGWAAAAIVWLIALWFNGSRAAFWSLRRLAGGGERVAERATHFRRVTAEMGRAWERPSS